MRYLLPSFLILLAPSAVAQDLATGQWTGELVWSQAEPVALTASIETCAEGLKIRLESDDARYQTEDTVIAPAGPVEFAIQNTERGYTLDCSLNRQNDGRLAGSCATGSSHARVSLEPPETSVIGCTE